MSTEPGSFTSNGSMIVVSNRLPFVLKRNETTGQLERKARLVGLLSSFLLAADDDPATRCAQRARPGYLDLTRVAVILRGMSTSRLYCSVLRHSAGSSGRASNVTRPKRDRSTPRFFSRDVFLRLLHRLLFLRFYSLSLSFSLSVFSHTAGWYI